MCIMVGGGEGDNKMGDHPKFLAIDIPCGTLIMYNCIISTIVSN